jgi:manganese/zinc/iron transport system substrate-binding protein
MKRFFSFIALSVLFVSCQPNTETAEPKERGKQILTTTSLLRDLVQNIVDDSYDVQSLMGNGVDPHLYKPSRKDIQRLREADVVVFNGLHLEGRMDEIRQQLQKTSTVITVSDVFQKERLINNSDFEDGYDPHFWFDLSMWVEAAAHIRNELEQLYPADSALFYNNFEAFATELKLLHRETFSILAEIPEERREIITSHDALSYFARAYNFKVNSLQGSSTSAEFGVRDVKEMVDHIIDNGIPAIFPENITSDQALRALVQGCEKRGYSLKIAEELYSDALGDGEAETFTGMFRANLRTIVDALK